MAMRNDAVGKIHDTSSIVHKAVKEDQRLKEEREALSRYGQADPAGAECGPGWPRPLALAGKLAGQNPL